MFMSVLWKRLRLGITLNAGEIGVKLGMMYMSELTIAKTSHALANFEQYYPNCFKETYKQVTPSCFSWPEKCNIVSTTYTIHHLDTSVVLVLNVKSPQ